MRHNVSKTVAGLSSELEALVRRFLTVCLGGLFAVAAVAKMVNPQAATAFAQYHLQKMSMPPELATSVVACAAATELLFCSVLFVWGARRAIVLPLAVLLVCYSALLAIALLDKKAPGCACFGVLSARASAMHLNLASVIRNVGLIGVCWYLFATGRAAQGFIRDDLNKPLGLPPARRAFTLIEVLVTIAVIAVLLGILFPALAGARKSARVTRELATTRQVATATTMYTDDFQSVMPFFARAGAPLFPMKVGDYELPDYTAYFQQAHFYPSLLYPNYYGDRASIEDAWLTSRGDPSGTHPNVWGTTFMLTQTAFAAPSYFGPFENPQDNALYRAVRTSECAFPSAKILVLNLNMGAYSADDESRTIKGKVLAALVDGSTGARAYDIENPNACERPLYAVPWAGMTTHNGIAGRDF